MLEHSVTCNDIVLMSDNSYDILWNYEEFSHSLTIKVKKYPSIFAHFDVNHHKFHINGPEYIFALGLIYYRMGVNTIDFRELDDEIFYDDEIRVYHFNCFEFDSEI